MLVGITGILVYGVYGLWVLPKSSRSSKHPSRAIKALHASNAFCWLNPVKLHSSQKENIMQSYSLLLALLSSLFLKMILTQWLTKNYNLQTCILNSCNSLVRGPKGTSLQLEH